MASSVTRLTTCHACQTNSSGQFTCHECQQIFCWKDLQNHQEEVVQQMNLLSENNLLKRVEEMDNSTHQHLFDQINRWETNNRWNKILNNCRSCSSWSSANIKTRTRSFSTFSTNHFWTDSIKSRIETIFSEIEINQWQTTNYTT